MEIIIDNKIKKEVSQQLIADLKDWGINADVIYAEYIKELLYIEIEKLHLI